MNKTYLQIVVYIPIAKRIEDVVYAFITTILEVSHFQNSFWRVVRRSTNLA